MQTLYVAQQGCYICLKQEQVIIKHGQSVLQTVPLPLLEQILIFGLSQVTTQVIRACLRQEIPMGASHFCKDTDRPHPPTPSPKMGEGEPD